MSVHPRLSYAYLTCTVLSKYGMLSRDLRDGKEELKLRLRTDLGAIELKKPKWEGDSVFIPLHLFSSFCFLEPEAEGKAKK